MSPAAKTLATAIDHHRDGRLADAEKLYRRILKRAPQHADALHLLGLVHHQRGRQDPALSYVDRALRVAPATPYYLNTLGEVRRARGELGPARRAFEAAIARKADFVEAHHNLGNLHLDAGDLAAALEAYDRALRFNPSFALSHSSRATVLRRLGDSEGAFAAAQRALEFDPDLADAHLEVALGYLLFDRHGEALTELKTALILAPQERARYLPSAVMALRRAKFDAYDPWYADLLVELFADPASEDRAVLPAALTMLARDPIVLDAMANAPNLIALAHRPLLAAVLRAEIVSDLRLEGLVLRIRDALLAAKPDPALLELFAAVVEQMFFTEYTNAEAAIPLALDADPLQRAWNVLRAATHRSLLHADGAEIFDATPRDAWPEPVARVIDRVYFEPKAERAWLAQIDVLTPIHDDTSRDVQAQYETHPYPRWIDLPRFEPEPLAASLSRTIGEVVDFPEQPRVLIAGAGTGRHPLARAMAHPEIDLLGIDLSKRSLAYARRMVERSGVSNVRLGQADLMELKSRERFHLIEAVGVLHHLADPLRGWRALAELLEPGGVMKVGLYSERARAAVVAARAWVAEEGFTPTADGLRAFRRRVKTGEGVPEAVLAVTRFRDFYSMGELRDLVFHVMEHRTSPLEIATTLEVCGLEFCGFSFPEPSVMLRFEAEHPGRSRDLSAWEAFEIEHPDTFRSMYQFYCRKLGG